MNPPAKPGLGGALADIGSVWNSYVRANMLTSPLTHIRNAAQGAYGSVEMPAERLLAAVVGQHLSRRAGDNVYAGEAGRMLRSYVGDFGSALSEGVKAAKGQGPQANVNQRQGVRQANTALGRGAEKVIGQTVGRLSFAPIQFLDGFFTALNRNAEFEALVYRKGRNQGLTGPQLNAYVDRARVNPTAHPAEMRSAEGQAQYRTLQQDMDGLGKGLNKIANIPGIGPMVFPFVKTPYNALKYAFERMPGTNLVPLIKTLRDPNATRAQAGEQIARAMTGYLTMVPLAFAYAAGGLTGAEPTNDTERDQWQAEGKQPYSIRIGDRWVSVSLFPALQATLIATASLGDAISKGGPDADLSEIALTSLLQIGREVAQRPVFDGLVNLAEAMEDPSKARNVTEGWVRDAQGNLIPGRAALNWVADAADPLERAADTSEESLLRGLPGPTGRQSLRAATTGFGDERRQTGSALERALNPLRTSEVRPERSLYEHFAATSPEEDTRIRGAAKRIEQWRKAPLEYPAPSEEDFRWAVKAGQGKLRAFGDVRSRANQVRRMDATAAKERAKGRLAGVGAFTRLLGGK